MHSVLLCQRPGLDSIRVFSALKFKERSLFTGRLNLFVCFNYCPVNIQIFQDSFDFNVLRNSATKHEKKNNAPELDPVKREFDESCSDMNRPSNQILRL